MPYIVQRIILNQYAWTRPAPGRLGPTGEGEYVKENGFGHEDWNFNYELAIDDYIYGYAYYEPSPQKRAELFQIAFATYQTRRWCLRGFYLDASFVANGAPPDMRVVSEKKRHLLELKAQNSLGGLWAKLTGEGLIRELRREAGSLRWKVQVKNVILLPTPVDIPERIYTSKNYHIARPKEINSDTFNSLRHLSTDAALEEDDETSFPEGREFFLKHRARERNREVVQIAKNDFLRKHGRFRCQACGFDFEEKYGELGRGFIEAHHTIPVSELSQDSATKVTDIALVCPNCHRMVHRKRPWLTMDQLQHVLK